MQYHPRQVDILDGYSLFLKFVNFAFYLMNNKHLCFNTFYFLNVKLFVFDLLLLLLLYQFMIICDNLH